MTHLYAGFTETQEVKLIKTTYEIRFKINQDAHSIASLLAQLPPDAYLTDYGEDDRWNCVLLTFECMAAEKSK